MNPIHYSALFTSGEMLNRALKNFNRLEMKEYQPDHVYTDGTYSWPGDWEGRTILALVMLAQATHREPKYLQEIMSRLPDRLNAQGYFGRVLPAGSIDEQQLSGNSWFLRAMVEYHLWKKDDVSYRVIQDIVHHLLLPSRGYYAQYPVLPEQRINKREAIGNLAEQQVGNWYLSSDIGCAFIMLDGATHAYQLLRLPALKDLLDEMIDKFMTIDLLGLSFQTHATLSATRGLLRYYETIGDARLLKKVELTFNLYMQEGMTENYANYNWFGRPDWTEPCAVIDSYIVAMGLWKHTEKLSYLEAAHHILYNGMGYGQRSNGGFGCDVCAGASDEMLSPKDEGLYEAFWCCTMRGGEGLSHALQSSYMWDEHSITIPFYHGNTAQFAFSQGELQLQLSTTYPIQGEVTLLVTGSTLISPITLKLYVPTWAPQESVTLRINEKSQEFSILNGFVEVIDTFPEGTKIELSFEIALRSEASLNLHSIPSVHSYRHGPLLLGIDNPEVAVRIQPDRAITYLGDATYRVEDLPVTLSPINDMFYKPEEEAVNNVKQVLFHSNVDGA